MPDLKFLNILAKDYPSIEAAQEEIIALNARRFLPKGTEYFFSDLHGEAAGFLHLLRSASGNIRVKISELFNRQLSEEEQNQLANLVYDPDRVLKILQEKGKLTDEWLALTLYRLVKLTQYIASKYSRARIREKQPELFGNIISELMAFNLEDPNKQTYFQGFVESIIQSDATEEFIVALCTMIQNITVDTLHIIGDIWDRGAKPHIIMEELLDFPDIDFQWGNHDVVWMGAAAGNESCMANVMRIAISYNNFDMLEDGYGINLRPLYSFAMETYGDDPCDRFMPRIFEENKYDRLDPEVIAKMHKAIAIIQFKLEGQLINRNPSFGMDHRKVLEMTDWDRYVLVVDGKDYPLKDQNFPTIDPKDPLKLTPEEEVVVQSMRASFEHSEPLHRHVRFIYTKGSTFLTMNNNLLFHGCIPMKEDGSFAEVTLRGKKYKGRALMEELNGIIREAYYLPKTHPAKQAAVDYMLYLWNGALSPMFGKSKMSTFENFFVEDKAVRKEVYNPYYQYTDDEAAMKRILKEFGLDPEKSRIINGHVPVKIKDGETPIKANGKLYVIDGGLAKAYQAKTGIAGYTLIFNSHHLALAEHRDFKSIENDEGDYTPELIITEKMPHRILEKETDLGRAIEEKITALTDLIGCYRSGRIREGKKHRSII